MLDALVKKLVFFILYFINFSLIFIVDVFQISNPSDQLFFVIEE